MKIGYARVSTRDQNVHLQIDALKKAGCERIYQDVASGAKTARPALDELWHQLRAGDTVVIWKLDRMGRSLKHLVTLVGQLIERQVGLLSLNDPLDTTSAQGRLVFNLFASLAEFERELIRERTQAGLSAARARGRFGGRPKGLSENALAKALAAESLYREKRLPVATIAQQLRISKSTLYSYLRHRGMAIGTHATSTVGNAVQSVATAQTAITPENTSDKADSTTVRIATVIVTLRLANQSRFVRGKKRAQENIERYCLSRYVYQREQTPEKTHQQAHQQMQKPALSAPSATNTEYTQYTLQIPYRNLYDLDQIVTTLLANISQEANNRHCISMSTAHVPGMDKRW